ncbi:MAG: hypothetical protein GKS07_08425 [Nitrosopumilus sp.]|nr:MAG: hypothetical protein GKS07_08425 [Nitrosopumilus sp.]
MGRYGIRYEDWSGEDLKRLGVILNQIMNSLDSACYSDKEESAMLRNWEYDMLDLFNKVRMKTTSNNDKNNDLMIAENTLLSTFLQSLEKNDYRDDIIRTVEKAFRKTDNY